MISTRIALIACTLLAAAPTAAEEKPLWEFGLGVATLNGPDYRGSDDRTTFVLPMPYVVYRGPFLKADGDSVRGLIHKSKRFELNVSVGGATPVRSDSSNARAGMPDLDPALEIGPSLNYSLVGTDESAWQMQIRLPVRAILTSDFSSVSYRGYLVSPTVNLDVREGIPGNWRIGVSLGPLYGDADMHDYYYGVEPEFATTERNAYKARSGYSGTRFNVSASNRIGDFWLGGYVRYEFLDGARFRSSPLVDSDHAVSVGVAAAYLFAKSKRMVDK